MTWNKTTKPVFDIVAGRILTPDGNQILLGINENLRLIYKEASSLWNKSLKQSSLWNKSLKQSSIWNKNQKPTM